MDILDRLQVARKAHAVTLNIYRITRAFPSSEAFGLTSQLRRSCSSIGSNIAEGDALWSNRAFARHLSIALGSTGEAQYQLRLATDLDYVTDEESQPLADQLSEIRGMLVGLIRQVKSRNPEKA